MSTALQRGQLHKPARPVANAADITEMVRGLIRYLNKAEMSPEEAVEKAKELFEGPRLSFGVVLGSLLGFGPPTEVALL